MCARLLAGVIGLEASSAEHIEVSGKHQVEAAAAPAANCITDQGARFGAVAPDDARRVALDRVERPTRELGEFIAASGHEWLTADRDPRSRASWAARIRIAVLAHVETMFVSKQRERSVARQRKREAQTLPVGVILDALEFDATHPALLGPGAIHPGEFLGERVGRGPPREARGVLRSVGRHPVDRCSEGRR